MGSFLDYLQQLGTNVTDKMQALGDNLTSSLNSSTDKLDSYVNTGFSRTGTERVEGVVNPSRYESVNPVKKRINLKKD